MCYLTSSVILGTVFVGALKAVWTPSIVTCRLRIHCFEAFSSLNIRLARDASFASLCIAPSSPFHLLLCCQLMGLSLSSIRLGAIPRSKSSRLWRRAQKNCKGSTRESKGKKRESPCTLVLKSFKTSQVLPLLPDSGLTLGHIASRAVGTQKALSTAS